MNGAAFSACGLYRYTLTRRITDGSRTVVFICLNPSTADAERDDPTSRRCIGYARDWGFARMVMLNLFAYRSTDPKALAKLSLEQAVGPENVAHIESQALTASIVVCAWGANAKVAPYHAYKVAKGLRQLGVELYALGFTKGSYPRHPLYLRRDLKPEPWNWESPTGGST